MRWYPSPPGRMRSVGADLPSWGTDQPCRSPTSRRRAEPMQQLLPRLHHDTGAERRPLTAAMETTWLLGGAASPGQRCPPRDAAVPSHPAPITQAPADARAGRRGHCHAPRRAVSGRSRREREAAGRATQGLARGKAEHPLLRILGSFHSRGRRGELTPAAPTGAGSNASCRRWPSPAQFGTGARPPSSKPALHVLQR